jgi:hypothetical protein
LRWDDDVATGSSLRSGCPGSWKLSWREAWGRWVGGRKAIVGEDGKLGWKVKVREVRSRRLLSGLSSTCLGMPCDQEGTTGDQGSGRAGVEIDGRNV